MKGFVPVNDPPNYLMQIIRLMEEPLGAIGQPMSAGGYVLLEALALSDGDGGRTDQPDRDG